MAEQPVNLSTAIYLGVFSRAEQRVLRAIFKAIAEGGGRCVATLAMLARDSNTSKSTTRNAIARAVEIGLLEKMERRSFCAVSLPNVLTYRKQDADTGVCTTLQDQISRLTLRQAEATIARTSAMGMRPRPQTDNLAARPGRINTAVGDGL
jgi:hypothetical protein